MSGLLLVLLSGFSFFGTALFGGVDLDDEPSEEPDETPEQLVEGGTSPLSEALQDPEETAETPPADASQETGEASDSSDDTEQTDTATSSEADTITGSLQDDTIDAGAGDDVVDGRIGDDTLAGGTGADSISGSEGDDVLYGGAVDGPDDGAADTLMGGAGNDQIYLGNDDNATGGAGADSFVRSASLSTRALVTDFEASEDVLVIEHQSDTPPTIDAQTVASDGVILSLSDGSQIEFAGLEEEIDPSLISFVDTRP